MATFALSKYEDAAKAFLDDHPIGTIVRAEKMLEWAAEKGNGLASDLLIDDANKRVSAIRRHLNSGGSSRNFSEASRFIVEVEDAKRKTFRVRRLFDYVGAQADVAFNKAAKGALAPLKRSKRALEDIKSEELDDDEQKAWEAWTLDITESVRPFGQLISDRVYQRAIKRLEAKGFTKEHARLWLDIVPQLAADVKLIKDATI